MDLLSRNQFGNCTLLESRTNFHDYVKQINATTRFDVLLLQACQSEICNAIFGNGNADISGIGMIVGYIFESALSLLLAVGFLIQKANIQALRPKALTEHTSSLLKAALKKAHKKFFDCAIFFTASIQIACVVVLVRRDFGISANGIGAFTTQITWAIAVLSMLPLLYPLVALESLTKSRSRYRLFLFSCCWLLSFYPFVSLMMGSFAPSQIGEGKGDGGRTDIRYEEWEKLTTLCLTGINTLTSREEMIPAAVGVASSLVVTIYALIRLAYCILSNFSTSVPSLLHSKISTLLTTRRQIYLIFSWILIVLSLTIPQFWGVWRLRGIQNSLADATRNTYVDNQWTFGQVVAVMIFAPVFTEVGYFLLEGEKVTV
ncbi:hypothetical protein BGZ60DRAFT_433479 [Tricladium varicosporioides]|nr:hypothetical protein BGZ60DRAFT_433479 [Hymenoscyphus varicosporioides]